MVDEPGLDSEVVGDPLSGDALEPFLEPDLRGRCDDLAAALGR
ncbi:hypothetical protein GCM10010377_48200 [Streptomyces viridiviolaceus]|nr:hypothetical protein GCM10010377_48200 [Streptomyces viridiviolaceus]